MEQEGNMTNQEAIEAIKLARSQVEWDYPMDYAAAFDKAIEALEQEPKTGHWIKGYTFPDGAYWKCDKCNELIKVKIPMRYCNNCGAKMVEPQESEVEDGKID